MLTRYIRLDLEYEADNFVRVNRVIRQLTDTIGLAGVKVLLVRDASKREHLDGPAPVSHTD